MHRIYKNLGETPLEALERFRVGQKISVDIPMTYAGRLDPMAEGLLIILVGDECKQKEKYLGIDKEYEVEIIFGIETDTYDALGLAELGKGEAGFFLPSLNKYVGRFTQEYPAYSSKTVNGKQLHELARSRELPEEMPTKEVEIYSIEQLDCSMISAADLKARICATVDLVKGNFRQEQIKIRWKEVLAHAAGPFQCLKLKVSCSSGTYMRSLAERIGKDRGTSAFALSIKRTKIGTWSV